MKTHILLQMLNYLACGNGPVHLIFVQTCFSNMKGLILDFDIVTICEELVLYYL